MPIHISTQTQFKHTIYIFYSIQTGILFIKTYVSPCSHMGGCNIEHKINSAHKILMQQNIMSTDDIFQELSSIAEWRSNQTRESRLGSSK